MKIYDNPYGQQNCDPYCIEKFRTYERQPQSFAQPSQRNDCSNTYDEYANCYIPQFKTPASHSKRNGHFEGREDPMPFNTI